MATHALPAFAAISASGSSQPSLTRDITLIYCSLLSCFFLQCFMLLCESKFRDKLRYSLLAALLSVFEQQLSATLKAAVVIMKEEQGDHRKPRSERTVTSVLMRQLSLCHTQQKI